MLWKKTIGHRDAYVAVTEVVDITGDSAIHGERTFRLRLADGSVQEWTFGARDLGAWQAGLGRGGLVVNASTS